MSAVGWYRRSAVEGQVASQEDSRSPGTPSVGHAPGALASVPMQRLAPPSPAVPPSVPPYPGNVRRGRFSLRPGLTRPAPPGDRHVLRIGILGAARIAPTAVIKPARRTGCAVVTAVAARDREPGLGIRP